MVPDRLHAKYLGSDQYFFGSTIALQTHHHLPDSPQTNLDKVVASIEVAYREEKVSLKDRYYSLKSTQYRSAAAGKLPKLKGTGRQCLGRSRVLARVFAEHMNADDEIHRTVLLGLEATAEVNRLYPLHANAYRIPPMDADIIVDNFVLSHRCAQLSYTHCIQLFLSLTIQSNCITPCT